MRLATHTDDLLFGISVLVFVGQKRISQQQKAQRTERITSAKAKTDEQAQAQAEEEETDAVEEAAAQRRIMRKKYTQIDWLLLSWTDEFIQSMHKQKIFKNYCSQAEEDKAKGRGEGSHIYLPHLVGFLAKAKSKPRQISPHNPHNVHTGGIGGIRWSDLL